jgi:Ni2+-binding GTPase involved in maturation of urease and hydrogenase
MLAVWCTRDFGKDLRFVLLAVTAGEDKPLTYPTRFNHAAATAITKSDLADAVECVEPQLDEISKRRGRAWKFSDRRPKQEKA